MDNIIKEMKQQIFDFFNITQESGRIYVWEKIEIQCLVQSDILPGGDEPYFKSNELWGEKKILGNMIPQGLYCQELVWIPTIVDGTGWTAQEFCVRYQFFDGLKPIELQGICDPSKTYNFILMEKDYVSAHDFLGNFSVENCKPQKQYDLYADGGHYRIAVHIKEVEPKGVVCDSDSECF